MHATASDRGIPSSAQFCGRCRLRIQAVILTGSTSLLWELLIATYPSLCWVASASPWKSCTSSKTSSCSNSWWKTSIIRKEKKGKIWWWLWENGREKQEGESGSRGVAALVERFELPGWVVRCDITYKHDQTNREKSGWKEQSLF